MSELKLIALDIEDLNVVSASMQDALIKVEDLSFDASSGQFLFAANRFAWEKSKSKFSFLNFAKSHERHRCQIVIKRVRNVRLKGISQSKSDEILSLLAIQFHQPGEGPEGQIELIMSADAGILLDVECIEVQLTDTGGAWETKFKPKHGT